MKRKAVALAMILILFVSAFPINVHAQEYDAQTGTLVIAGSFSAGSLSGSQPVYHLRVSGGTLREADFELMREQYSTTLQSLDFSEATVDGGILFPNALKQMRGLEEVKLSNTLTEIATYAFLNSVVNGY